MRLALLVSDYFSQSLVVRVLGCRRREPDLIYLEHQLRQFSQRLLALRVYVATDPVA